MENRKENMIEGVGAGMGVFEPMPAPLNLHIVIDQRDHSSCVSRFKSQNLSHYVIDHTPREFYADGLGGPRNRSTAAQSCAEGSMTVHIQEITTKTLLQFTRMTYTK